MTDIQVKYTTHFVKQFKKLSPKKKQEAIKSEKLFREDPSTLQLKTHKLTGKLHGLWAFSINFHDRIIFEFIDGNKIIFHRIGSHDVYK